MPRRIADDGPTLLSGAHSNMLVDMFGRARLSSRNLMPNGDLDEDDENGNLLYWTLEAPPKPIGWYPYYGDDVGKPLYRQEFEPIWIGEPTWTLDRPWIFGPEPTDPTERRRVAAPEKFFVDLVELGMVGFAPGRYLVGINYGVGNPNLPRRRLRWTPVESWTEIEVTNPGSGITVPLAGERPEGITFHGVFATRVGQGIQTATLQEIINTRYSVRDSVILRGPWKNGHPPPAANTTFVGNLGEVPPPSVILSSRNPGNRRQRAAGPIGGGWFQFRVLIKTEFGFTLPGQPTQWLNMSAGARTGALWVHPRPMPGVRLEAFAVEVRGREAGSDKVTEWQRVSTVNGRGEFAQGSWIPVYNWRAEGLPTNWKLDSASSAGEGDDTSGIESPQTELGELSTFGGAPLTPGTKRLKATWAYQEEDDLDRVEERESGPSPLVPVAVPGAGGAATHTVRMHRPPGGNEEYNPLFNRLDPDEIEVDWVRDPDGPTGVVFGPGRGFVELTDRTGALTSQTVYYSAPIDVRDGRTRAVRMTMHMLEGQYISGHARLDLEFITATGQTIGSVFLGAQMEAGRKHIHRTYGSESNPKVNHKLPPGTAYVRRRIQHVGNAITGARSFVCRYKDVGTVRGEAHPLKRFDVVERDELEEQDFPVGGYIAVLSRERVDEENIRPRQNAGVLIRDLVDFDDGIPGDIVQIVEGGATQEVTTDQPISGERSVRCRDADASVAGRSLAYYLAPSPRADMTGVARLRLDELPASGECRVGEMADGSGNVLAAFLYREGNLYARSFASGGATQERLALRLIDATEDIQIEVFVDGAGGGNGSAHFYASREGHRRRKVATINGVNWQGRQSRRWGAGICHQSDPSSTATITVDEIEVWARAESDWRDVPGRMVEYWGPPDTPKHPHNFMRGQKVPVDGSTYYVFSTHAEFRGVSVNTSVLSFVAKDIEGNVLERYGFLVENVSGSRRMRRYHRRVFTPPEAAYIEFEDNSVGAGLIRACAIQEEHDTFDGKPTPFTNQHAPSGFVEVTFSTMVPGVPKGSALDVYNRVRRWRGAEARFDAPAGTDVEVKFASRSSSGGDDGVGEFTPLVSDWSQVPLGDEFKIRAELSTGDLEVTPELYELLLDFQRSGPVVCLADGTEVPGGAVPIDFPAVQDVPNVVADLYADNTTGFSTFGKRQPRADGWKIEAYFDEGVRKLSNQVGRGDSVLIVEELGRRFHCQVLAAPFPPPERLMNYLVANREYGGFHFESDAIEAEVLAEEEL